MPEYRRCPHGLDHPPHAHSCDGCWCEGERDRREYGWSHDTAPVAAAGHWKTVVEGEIEVCARCVNSDGNPVAWELAHPPVPDAHVVVGAEGIDDLLTMLGVNPTERSEGAHATTAEVISRAVLATVSSSADLAVVTITRSRLDELEGADALVDHLLTELDDLADSIDDHVSTGEIHDTLRSLAIMIRNGGPAAPTS